MALKTYSGGCHCGKLRFEADLNIAAGTVKCNCSGCTKARSWLIFVTADRFRLLAGRESQRNPGSVTRWRGSGGIGESTNTLRRWPP